MNLKNQQNYSHMLKSEPRLSFNGKGSRPGANKSINNSTSDGQNQAVSRNRRFEEASRQRGGGPD